MILLVAAAFVFCVILKLVRKFCLLPIKLLHLFASLAVVSFKFAHLNRANLASLLAIFKFT